MQSVIGRSAEIGDAVDVYYPLRQMTRLGMIKEVRDGVVTILIGGGEGHCIVLVNPTRLERLGPAFWRIVMRK